MFPGCDILCFSTMSGVSSPGKDLLLHPTTTMDRYYPFGEHVLVDIGTEGLKRIQNSDRLGNPTETSLLPTRYSSTRGAIQHGSNKVLSL